MANIIYWLLNMSITGALTIIVIILLRKINRIPRQFIRIIWMIPMIRFLIPFGVAGRFSIMNLLSSYAVKTVHVPKEEYLVFSNYLQQVDKYFPMVYKTDVLEGLFIKVFYIWCIVTVILLLGFLMLYVTTWKDINQAKHVSENIYSSNSINGAAVYGILNPKILMNENLSEEHRSFILQHEQVHIRKKDNLYRCILIVTVCIHWFNPFAWCMLKKSMEDIELACDELVIQSMEDKARKEYAMTVLNESYRKSIVVTAFGGAKVKVRIKNILNYRKITILSGICFTIFCVLVFLSLLTNGKNN